MLNSLLTKVIGTRNERELKRIQATYLDRINALEPELERLSDDALSAKTAVT
jgi:preprotein translocase subunit SecA